MTTFNKTYNIVTPPGSGDPAEADDRIREIKAAVQERENVDHYWPLTGTEVSDADTGEQRKITIRTLSAVEVAALSATKAYIYRLVTNGELYFKDANNNTIQITTGGILNSLNLTGAQTVAGVKTFSAIPKIPTTAPTADAEAAGKKYVDDSLKAYIKISDTKAQNTNGGTFTSGAWRTRVLNTEDSDVGSHAALASNQITLSAGTYECRISCPAFKVEGHQARLYNTTGAAIVLIGTSESADSSNNGSTRSFIVGKFTIATSQALEVQHRCGSTQASNGLGARANFTSEVYTIAEFWKVP